MAHSSETYFILKTVQYYASVICSITSLVKLKSTVKSLQLPASGKMKLAIKWRHRWLISHPHWKRWIVWGIHSWKTSTEHTKSLPGDLHGSGIEMQPIHNSTCPPVHISPPWGPPSETKPDIFVPPTAKFSAMRADFFTPHPPSQNVYTFSPPPPQNYPKSFLPFPLLFSSPLVTSKINQP